MRNRLAPRLPADVYAKFIIYAAAFKLEVKNWNTSNSHQVQ